MSSSVTDERPIEPCPAMDSAHAAVERGDMFEAATHYGDAAGVALASVDAADVEDWTTRAKWHLIADLRLMWAARARLVGRQARLVGGHVRRAD